MTLEAGGTFSPDDEVQVQPREGMAKDKEMRLFEDEMVLAQRENEVGNAVGLV